MIGTSSARFLISAVVVLAVSYSSLAQTQGKVGTFNYTAFVIRRTEDKFVYVNVVPS